MGGFELLLFLSSFGFLGRRDNGVVGRTVFVHEHTCFLHSYNLFLLAQEGSLHCLPVGKVSAATHETVGARLFPEHD